MRRTKACFLEPLDEVIFGKVDGHKDRAGEPERGDELSFGGLGRGVIDFEEADVFIRKPKRSSIVSGAEDRHLGTALRQGLFEFLIKIARAGTDAPRGACRRDQRAINERRERTLCGAKELREGRS